MPTNTSSRFLAAAALLGALAGRAQADDWLSQGLDGARSRVSGERAGTSFGAALWEHTLAPGGDAIYRALLASPVVADGYLVYGTPGGMVRGLREADGQPVWEWRAGDGVQATPALDRGRAYVVETGHRLTALRLADGAVLWRRDLVGISYAAPAVVDGSVLVVSGEPRDRLHRLDAETGKQLWEAGEGVFQDGAHAAPAVAEGHVIVGEVRGRYHAFALATGAHEWTATTGGLSTRAAPLVVNGRVFLAPGGEDPRVHALELDSGQPVRGWPVTLPAPAPPAGSHERGYVVSSPAGQSGYLLLQRRIEDRLDRDGDGVPEEYVLEESLHALDPDDGRVLWTAPLGRLVTEDPNRIPTQEVCPTPALYRGPAGWLVAAASSLSPQLRVLDLQSGTERWATALSAPTRGSPLLANGRLVVGTDAGVIHSLASRTNVAPGAPSDLWPGGGWRVDAAAVALRWGPAVDPEGAALEYEVRVDDDGEVLMDWDLRAVAGSSRTLALPMALAPGRLHTFRVRARDSAGAWSPWSAPGQFQAVATAAVQLDGMPVASLPAAVAAARAGGVITLGAGTYPLADTLRLPAGVTLAGVAPHLTTISGKGLAVAVQAGAGNRLRQLTVADAATGVEVTSGDDARLQNVILRDNAEAGLRVAGGAGAALVSATLVRNGTAVAALGRIELRNAIVTANAVGVQAGPDGKVSGGYNDVAGNRSADYQDAQRAATDRADLVTFPPAAEDLRLTTPQPTTDQGDPADDFALEPAPNGGRINLGAFGNTPFAELSAGGAPPPPPAGDEPGGKESGGGLCALGGTLPDGSVLLVLLALPWRWRRRR